MSSDSKKDIICVGSVLPVFLESSANNAWVQFNFSDRRFFSIPQPTRLDPHTVVGAIILETKRNESEYSASFFTVDRIGVMNITHCETKTGGEEGIILSLKPWETHTCSVLSSQTVSVVDCNLSESSSRQTVMSSNLLETKTPHWALRGVAAVSGTRGIRVPHNDLPPGAKIGTSWSFSMWAYFISFGNEARHQNRILFYRGSGQSRTPSAWFDIDSNRLLMRCSTNSEPDIGATSISSIPLREWVHLVFVFTNHSFLALTESGLPSFTYKMYLDGRLDSELTFASPLLVESNEGALIIGGMVDNFVGSPALLARLQIFDGELTLSNIKAEVNEFRFLFHHLKYSSHASIPVSLTQDVHLLRGIVAATDLFSAWGDQISDSFPRKVQSEFERKKYLDSLLFRANKRLEHHSQLHSASENEAWEITLDKYGLFYDPLTKQFSYSLDSSIHNRIAADVISKDVAEAAVSSFGRALQNLGDCKADVFENFYSELDSAASIDVPGSLSLLADFDQQPLRDTCPDELRRMIRSHMKSGLTRSIANQNVFSSLASVLGLTARSGGLTNHSQIMPPSSTHYYTRNEARARKRRVHAAIQGDAHSLYMLGVDYMIFGSPFPDTLLPNSFDESFGFGLIHLSASLSEPYAWQLLSRKYSTGEGGINSIRAFVNSNHVSLKRLSEIAFAQERLFNGLEEKSQKEDYEQVNHFFSMYSTGVVVDKELATFYSEWAADESNYFYHLPTGRPLHEMQRLSIDAADSGEVERIQRGNDEPEIALQRYKCEHQHDSSSCGAMGDLLSWGARGLNRDLGEAFRFYELGSALGDLSSKASAAQMLLKGEGVPRNVSGALKHYDEVISSSNQSSLTVRALNGLGFAHFHGVNGTDGLLQNHSLAFSYFQRSAELNDGDATFNKGVCQAFGFGTQKNLSLALETYQKGANLGHFDCIYSLGRNYAHGTTATVTRDVSRALPFLTAIANVGPWASLLRRGFDRYLAHDYEGAFLHYSHAYLLGYDIGAANAAYLLQRKLFYRHHQQQNVAFLLHEYSFSRNKDDIDSALSIADFLATGQGGAKRDVSAAISLYERASLAGSPQAAFSLGLLFEEGDGVHQSFERAEQYYSKALLLSNSSSSAQQVARLALARLAAKRWLTSYLKPYLGIGMFYATRTKQETRNVWKTATSNHFFSTRWLETSVFRTFLGTRNGLNESNREFFDADFIFSLLISILTILVFTRILRIWRR